MKLIKHTTLAASVIAGLAVSSAAVAQEWSANVGLMSEYHFRGLLQNNTATANGGVDYANGGFYAGVWAADVDDGLEIDLYGGYGVEFDSGLSLGFGLTTYQYTGDFDSEYNELNLSAGYGAFSLEYTIGEQGDDAGLGITEADYTFLGLSFESEAGVYVTFGTFGDDFDGDYIEVGYGTSFEGFDVGMAVVSSDSDLNDDESLYFTIGRSFDL